ncbi:MAG: C39 family peptidase [Oscillospiraceae bacterium]|nr:C39 family peptidase [Oscillospiraceae bacterium]
MKLYKLRYKKHIYIIVILAILCIGTAELIACRFFNPELYDRITTPIVNAAHAAGDFVVQLGTRISLLFEKDEPEHVLVEPIDSQLVAEPEIIYREPVSDPTITEIKTVDGQDILTGGPVKVVYYNQGDEQWSSQPYGTDNIGGYGCGPVVMSMAISSMTEHEADPVYMADWAVQNGYWASKGGSYPALIQASAQAHGLTCKPMTTITPNALNSTLMAGNIVVALMGPGHFTQSGHFILLRGVTLGGDVLIADPSSLDRSLTAWEPEVIINELSQNKGGGGPIWIISVSTI